MTEQLQNKQFTLTSPLPPQMSKKDKKKKEEPKLKVINHPADDSTKKASKRKDTFNPLQTQ